MQTRRLRSVPSDNASGVRSLLLHPRVDAVVCEVTAESLRDEGVPFERCDVALLLSSPSRQPQEINGTNSTALSAEQLLTRLGAAHGTVIVNVDEPRLAELCREFGSRAIPISLDENHKLVQAARASNVRTALVRGANVVLARGHHELVVPVADVDLASLAAFAIA